jgi:hypothetical protein
MSWGFHFSKPLFKLSYIEKNLKCLIRQHWYVIYYKKQSILNHIAMTTVLFTICDNYYFLNGGITNDEGYLCHEGFIFQNHFFFHKNSSLLKNLGSLYNK